MSFAGTWNLKVQSPQGEREFTLTLEDGDDGSLSGKVVTPRGEADISGSGDDGKFELTANMQGPMGAIELKFTGEGSGDEASGQVAFGTFGNGSFTASRAG